MKIKKIHYEDIYWNDGEQKEVCKKLRYYDSIGYCDCQIEIDENGNEEPRNIYLGDQHADYCTQIHKIIFPKNW